jgi:hypothetical protein
MDENRFSAMKQRNQQQVSKKPAPQEADKGLKPKGHSNGSLPHTGPLLSEVGFLSKAAAQDLFRGMKSNFHPVKQTQCC